MFGFLLMFSHRINKNYVPMNIRMKGVAGFKRCLFLLRIAVSWGGGVHIHYLDSLTPGFIHNHVQYEYSGYVRSSETKFDWSKIILVVFIMTPVLPGSSSRYMLSAVLLHTVVHTPS